MVAVSHKAKQYGWYALKVFILFIAFWFILKRLTEHPNQSYEMVFSRMQWNQLPNYLSFFFMAFLNWFFEILKWKKISSPIKPLSFKEAARQSLIALTVSLSTPNRIGEYGAKVYFFDVSKRKKILLLTFFSNSIQMMVTTFFGILGFAWLYNTIPFQNSNHYLLGFLVGVLVLLSTVYFFRKKEFLMKGFTIQNVFVYLKDLPASLWTQAIGYSLLRYVTFSGLFYLLLHFFGGQTTLKEALPFIFLMYLLVSVVPMFMVFDVVIKGGIAVWLFHFLGVDEIIILTTVFLMWLLNFVFPAIFGSFLLLKSPKK